MAIESNGVNIVGRRTTELLVGVTVVEFTLGGGLIEYSWISHYRKLIVCRRIFNTVTGFREF